MQNIIQTNKPWWSLHHRSERTHNLILVTTIVCISLVAAVAFAVSSHHRHRHDDIQPEFFPGKLLTWPSDPPYLPASSIKNADDILVAFFAYANTSCLHAASIYANDAANLLLLRHQSVNHIIYDPEFVTIGRTKPQKYHSLVDADEYRMTMMADSIDLYFTSSDAILQSVRGHVVLQSPLRVSDVSEAHCIQTIKGIKK